MQLQARRRELTRQPIHAHLDDGTEILLRPIRPEDKQLLATGMERLSERSRRLRFLAPTEKLSRSQLAYLTEVDQVDHQAWGVLSAGEPIAVGRIVRIGDEEAEVAITVLDEWQQRGIGEMMIRFLAVLAGDVGVRRLMFISLPENQGIARLLARFDPIVKTLDGLTNSTVQVDNVPPPHFLATSGNAVG